MRRRTGRIIAAGIALAASAAACGGTSAGDIADDTSSGLDGGGGGITGDGAVGGGESGTTAAQCPSCPVMPVEVLGPANTVVDSTFTLASPATAVSLVFTVHSLDDEAKASFALNDGAFVAITNTSVAVTGAGKRFGGIGGGYHTLSFVLPLAAMTVPADAGDAGPTGGLGTLVSGANTLHFRFNGTDGRSLGYRVLSYNVLDGQGKALLAAASFVQEDPSTWTAPVAGMAAFTAGETVWKTATLVDSPLDPSPLLAHCTDCHAQDGRDLKYFNYSNNSIRQRAMYHGLTADQGDQIASYIRGNPSPAPGRPWNPPYQPGPSIATAPVSSWAAGAGLDAVVDDETTTPSFTSPAPVYDGTAFADVGRQTSPIPLQLIDWNRWLPVVHPLDAMKKRGLDFTTTQDFTLYQALRTSLATPGYATHYLFGSLVIENDLGNWANALTYDLYEKLFPANAGVTTSWTPQDLVETYSAGQWNAVKQWELMQEFSLEGVKGSLFGVNGSARSWFSDRHVFDASPAIIGRLSTDDLMNAVSAEGVGDPPTKNQYLANSWYQLQIMLNAGDRQRATGGHNTVDWGYVDGHFADLERATEEGQPLRVALFHAASLREHDSDVGPEDENWGWNLRDEVPTNLHLEFPEWASEPNAAAIVETGYLVWLEKTASFDQAQWKVLQDLEEPGDTTWPQDHTGQLSADGQNVGTEAWVLGDSSQGDLNRSVADQFYAALPVMQKLGVSPAVVGATASYCKFMWPATQNGWDTFRTHVTSEPTPANVKVMAGVESITVSWSAVNGARSYNVKRARAGDAASLAVALLVPGTSFVDKLRAPGQTYNYTVSANFGDGEGPDSAVASTAATTGTVMHLTFDESGSTVSDSSTLANPAGTIIGTAARAPSGTGNALVLDGKSYVSFPRSLHRWIGATSTVTFWMQTKQVGISYAWETIGVLGAPYDRREGHQMTQFGILDPEGHVGALFSDLNGPTGYYGTATVNDGAWHHVAISRDANSGDVRIYVDGKLSGTATGGPGIFGTRVYSVGKLDNTDSSNLQGQLDDLWIDDYLLSDAQIAARFAAGH